MHHILDLLITNGEFIEHVENLLVATWQKWPQCLNIDNDIGRIKQIGDNQEEANIFCDYFSCVSNNKELFAEYLLHF